MIDIKYSAIAIGITALVTIALRFLPFLIFSGNKKTPAVIEYLGKVLPYSIMGMLVIYCLKGTDFSGPTHGIPEVIASLFVIIIHYLKKNTLLSIAGGTVLYMILVQFVF